MLNNNENTSQILRKSEAVHCFSNLKLLNQSMSDIFKTDFSEKNPNYAVLADKSYEHTVHILKNLQDMLLVSEPKKLKDISKKRNIQLLNKDVRIFYLNDVIKVEIPTYLLKCIKKKTEIDTVLSAVELAIDDFFLEFSKKMDEINDFKTCQYAIVENYVIPELYHIDLDRIDFSPVKDLLSIRFCNGFDDSRFLKANLKSVRNHKDEFYACLYLIRMKDLPAKIEWLMNDF